MIDDLIIIIPTHNRQHYLRRVIKYYSSFPCKVYICDSSKEDAKIIDHGNIIYRWVPKLYFYEKILAVIDETKANYYALSPDDDFLKESTLMECYDILCKNDTYSFGIGKQIFFDEPFVGVFYTSPGTNNLAEFKSREGETRANYLQRFWSNYQNILWSIYKREAIKNAFTTLSTCNLKNGNFVELILGIESLRIGDVYVSHDGFNFREEAKVAHWGNTTPTITTENIKRIDSLSDDYHSFLMYYKNDGGHANQCLNYYLGSGNSNTVGFRSLIKKIIPNSVISFVYKLVPAMTRRRKEYVDDDIMKGRLMEAICNVNS